VTLNASAGTGYLFTVWGGTAPSVPKASCTATTSTGTTTGSSTTGSCTFSIIENNTASATFP
jgi:hypothetical protein